jgi:hypothetical protein
MTQNEIIEAIKAERVRQGIVHPIVAKKLLPDNTDAEEIKAQVSYLKIDNDLEERFQDSNWYGVFLEELYEVFAETDHARIKEEAIQLAALCVRLCETL